MLLVTNCNAVDGTNWLNINRMTCLHFENHGENHGENFGENFVFFPKFPMIFSQCGRYKHTSWLNVLNINDIHRVYISTVIIVQC